MTKIITQQVADSTPDPREVAVIITLIHILVVGWLFFEGGAGLKWRGVVGGDLCGPGGPEPSPEPFKPFSATGLCLAIPIISLLILYPCFSPSSTPHTHLEEAEACGFPAGILYRSIGF